MKLSQLDFCADVQLVALKSTFEAIPVSLFKWEREFLSACLAQGLQEQQPRSL